MSRMILFLILSNNLLNIHAIRLRPRVDESVQNIGYSKTRIYNITQVIHKGFLTFNFTYRGLGKSYKLTVKEHDHS